MKSNAVRIESLVDESKEENFVLLSEYQAGLLSVNIASTLQVLGIKISSEMNARVDSKVKRIVVYIMY